MKFLTSIVLMLALVCVGACSGNPAAPTPTVANPAIGIVTQGNPPDLRNASVSGYTLTLDNSTPRTPGFYGFEYQDAFDGRLAPGAHELRLSVTNMNNFTIVVGGGSVGNTGGIPQGSLAVVSSQLTNGVTFVPMGNGCGLTETKTFSGTLVLRFNVILADYLAVCH